jgi:hypothetical protein
MVGKGSQMRTWNSDPDPRGSENNPDPIGSGSALLFQYFKRRVTRTIGVSTEDAKYSHKMIFAFVPGGVTVRKP